MEIFMETLQISRYLHYLKPRPRDWHKGNSGYVVIVGGDKGFPGAPRMAAEAALRVGAGLAIVATHPVHAATLNEDRPEIISHAVTTANALTAILKKANVIIVGPGLGQSAWSKKMLTTVMKSSLPKVIDADALNLIAKYPKKFSLKNAVITPHPAEAARLLNSKTSTIQENREKAVIALQKKYNAVAVLKGYGTLICEKDNTVSICKAGNPGMATAGMGDVLSGVMGGLIAQGIPIADAAKLGVLLHAMAGDMSAEAAGERGMIATDLMPFLRKLVNPE